MIEGMWGLVDIPEGDKKEINRKISNVIYAVIHGTIILALIQGVIAAIGYWLIGGMDAPIFWGLMTALTALIPIIGTAMIWIPASLILVINSIIMSDTSGLVRGIALFAYGALVISSIDNFLRPKIVGDRARIHPIIVLLGVFGGLVVFGLIGGIVGPLILALIVTFSGMYRQYVLGGKSGKQRQRVLK